MHAEQDILNKVIDLSNSNKNFLQNKENSCYIIDAFLQFDIFKIK